MKQLFPLAPAAIPRAQGLPLYRDVAWDFEADRPIFSAGEPVMVEGAEAVTVWCYHALRAVRFLNEARSFTYGSDLTRLVGQQWSEDVKRAEAARYVTEALTVSPYVEGVSVSGVSFADGRMSAMVDVSTVYGRVSIHV